VRQQVPNGDVFLAIAPKLRPVLRDRVIVVKEATLFQQVNASGCNPLGNGEAVDDGVGLPGSRIKVTARSSSSIHDQAAV
jgi:hypothetical protein